MRKKTVLREALSQSNHSRTLDNLRKDATIIPSTPHKGKHPVNVDQERPRKTIIEKLEDIKEVKINALTAMQESTILQISQKHVRNRKVHIPRDEEIEKLKQVVKELNENK